jgi:hypothetical protein
MRTECRKFQAGRSIYLGHRGAIRNDVWLAHRRNLTDGQMTACFIKLFWAPSGDLAT